MLTDVYVALGGNIGDTHNIFQQALKQIANIPQVHNLKVSKFYRTAPVSDIPQDDYLNAVCHFQTALTARNLLSHLQKIETDLGKVPKKKNEPRKIDLDIILFGLERHNDHDLEIPHPRWQERQFVIVPLADLVTTLPVPTSNGIKVFNVKSMIN